MLKWFGNLKIAYKIIFGFLIGSAVNVVTGIIGIVGVVTDSSGTAGQSSAGSLTVLIIATVIGLGVSLMLGFWISRQLSYPIGRIATVADMLAKGDVNLESFLIKEDYEFKFRKDEIGALALAFSNLMGGTKKQVEETKKLEERDLTTEITLRSDRDALGIVLSRVANNFNDLMGILLSSAEQVDSSASLVAHSSATLSQGATEQASSVQQLTASFEQIAAQTAHNAQNAEKASQLALNAQSDAEKGNTQMNDLLKAMEMINSSSGSINKIIKVIDDIAFQTNILALNAAVEAARAGQHGKGFAVVAEEVRTLAAKSANAAKETTDMIEDSIKNVGAGIKIANDTASALKKIVTGVSDATELVGSIAIASKEQAMNLEQLNQGILQVSQVVQNNAATSEESAAASEELASQADQLKQIVGTFKIKQRTSAVSSVKPSLTASAKTQISLGGDFGKY